MHSPTLFDVLAGLAQMALLWGLVIGGVAYCVAHLRGNK